MPVPIAIGALPFDRRADGELVVPELTLVAPADGRAFVLVVGAPSRVEVLLSELARGLPAIVKGAGSATPTAPPDDFRLASARPHQDFLSRVNAALAEIRTGRIDKVVLAREVTVHAEPAASPSRSARSPSSASPVLHDVCRRRVHRR